MSVSVSGPSAVFFRTLAGLAGGVVCTGAAVAQRCQWEALEAGSLSGQVRAVAVFDDGRGPALYAGGILPQRAGNPGHNIVRWDGSSWSPLGTGTGTVTALAEFDDGTGAALYVGGGFRRAGEVEDANGIARWDGREWSRLGTGMHRPGPYGSEHMVGALAAFDGGAGPALVAGGKFDEAGGVPALNVARWDGQSWSALGSGLGAEVRSLAVYDDGNGSAVYAGGLFNGNVARWDGQAWRMVRWGTDVLVNRLAVYDDGSGPGLYAGGQFNVAGGVAASRIARYDGVWSALGSGTSGEVWALGVYDDGTGPGLYVGGSFSRAGEVQTWGIARWDGQWSALGSGLFRYPIGPNVFGMVEFDDGSGPALYIGGAFTEAGGVPANCIARWRCERACYADCDGNETLDFFDFLCFQNAFLAGDPYADCDGDGVLDFFDFLCFQNEFLAGCP